MVQVRVQRAWSSKPDAASGFPSMAQKAYVMPGLSPESTEGPAEAFWALHLRPPDVVPEQLPKSDMSQRDSRWYGMQSNELRPCWKCSAVAWHRQKRPPPGRQCTCAAAAGIGSAIHLHEWTKSVSEHLRIEERVNM